MPSPDHTTGLGILHFVIDLAKLGNIERYAYPLLVEPGDSWFEYEGATWTNDSFLGRNRETRRPLRL
jgi:hypothetical protein